MKVVTFLTGGEVQVGMLDPSGDTVAPFALPPEEAARGVVALIGRPALPPLGEPVPIGQVSLLAPVPRPARNIFCVGKNYYAHALEFAGSGFDSSAAKSDIPTDPIIFSKVPESVTGPGAAIEIDPGVSTAIDYEAELAVIVGTGGRGITRAQAMDHVWGYTIINDVTARDLQGRHSQWLLAKSLDTFCPMGPCAVTADDIDLSQIAVRCFVNGELRQNAQVADLIFDIPTLIETISAGITLMPGDIIATGTPAGVGIGFTPPRYLAGGESVRVEIDGIGALENPVRVRA
ncbi:MAG: fumarylacetoacetate hydrolase family protein [Pararhodobacter sp.]